MHLSLRKKVALAFSAVTIVLLVTQALGVRLLAEAQEERLITALIRDDIASVVRGYEAAPSTLPPLDDRLNGYLSAADSSSPALPTTVAQLPPGTHELIADGREIHVTIVPFNHVRLYRVYNFSVYEKHFKEVINALMATTGVFALVAIWLAFGLSGMLVRQVANLANQVTKLRQDSEPSIQSGEFDEQELIGLVDAFNDYHRRMADMVAREKEFTGNVSHELRTPLTAIKTSCELLDQAPGLDDRARARIAQIERAADHMRELVSALLLLAREETSSTTQPVALASLVTEVLQPFAERIRAKDIDLVVQVPMDLRVDINDAALTIVLSNLIENAVRYTDVGHIRLAWKDRRLCVEDSGSGIAKEAQPHIFDRLYRGDQAESVARGFGIGLAIVQKLCARYGWPVTVDSALGQGTRVSLRLPVV
ncbi:HAMP domain-containing sensor histidine kinase [Pandoraea sp. XJJ-1]|uniref:sensor histidine kinase n=1 Tax=unclassified Pandoraea TaxID=2624094 RepID=UPI00034DED61|nr:MULTISPECIES: HAMP domain-containing sensor histidine kinase [unclassified Pandoraea]WAL85021.1 HAMP domain-containing sensor histidine kinase [Pandoraea sp. XJJ-1]